MLSEERRPMVSWGREDNLMIRIMFGDAEDRCGGAGATGCSGG